MDRRQAIWGCLAAGVFMRQTNRAAQAQESSLEPTELYRAMRDGAFTVPAVNLARINPIYFRQSVVYPSSEPAGTIIIDPHKHFLYHIAGNGLAMRYGVGVGRQGFSWSGTATVNSKQEWPDWYPPQEMLERQPELMGKMSELRSGVGMHGGPRNPLGARALYLWQNNKDTLFRIHGTTEPWSIGTNASSGCIRMINQDAMDLYERTPVGAKVIVLGAGQSRGQERGSERMGQERVRNRLQDSMQDDRQEQNAQEQDFRGQPLIDGDIPPPRRRKRRREMLIEQPPVEDNGDQGWFPFGGGRRSW